MGCVGWCPPRVRPPGGGGDRGRGTLAPMTKGGKADEWPRDGQVTRCDDCTSEAARRQAAHPFSRGPCGAPRPAPGGTSEGQIYPGHEADVVVVVVGDEQLELRDQPELGRHPGLEAKP